MQCTWKGIGKRAGIILAVSAVSVSAIYFGGMRIRQAVTTMTAPKKETPVIVLDAGHGGADGGCVSVNDVPEKGINLNILLSLRDFLRMEGYTVEVTRDTDRSIHDDGVEGIANQKSSDMDNRLALFNQYDNAVCISVHQNQFTDAAYSGAQMFYSDNVKGSGALAQALQNAFVTQLQPENTREIKQCGKELYLCYFSENPTVMAECAGVEFTVKGSVVKQTGWRAVYGEEKEEITIPGWQEGDTLTPKGSSITEGKTKPKPLHTEATLLSAMETAGKEIEDDALRQAMKDCGIGTPATRASIIETLFKRGYMERCKKSLVPTEKGLALNSVVKTMRIADVAMTGEWEKELARIERGELSDDTFRKEIEAYTREITSELISCDKLFGSRDSGCACPKCGTGRMRFYGKVVRCDNTECGLPVFRLKAGRTLSDDEIKDLLTEGHTKLLKGFKSKQGKSFDAVVAFDGEYNTTFVFPEAKKDKKFSGRKK